MFSSEFCEISKNTFFTEHLWETASLLSVNNLWKAAAESNKLKSTLGFNTQNELLSTKVTQIFFWTPFLNDIK